MPPCYGACRSADVGVDVIERNFLHTLSERRVLVVEDEVMLALLVVDILRAAEAEVVGPAFTVMQAEALLAQGSIDAAMLDVNLDGDAVWSLAETLDRLAVPFVLVSGLSRAQLPARWSERAALSKPFTAEQLIIALTHVLHRSAAPPPATEPPPPR